MRSLALLVVGFVAAARVPAQQPGTLRIGSAAARPGEKGSGFIDVPAGVDSGTRVPLTIVRGQAPGPTLALIAGTHGDEVAPVDRKSTRLNSSHGYISYAVFCLKKKKKKKQKPQQTKNKTVTCK